MVNFISMLKRMRDGIRALLDDSGFRSPEGPSRFYKFLHFWVLVARSFVRNRCPVRASALAYTTLLALIPMLAVAISVTSSLLKKEGEDKISDFIDKVVLSMIPTTVATTNAAGDIGLTNLNATVDGA